MECFPLAAATQRARACAKGTNTGTGSEARSYVAGTPPRRVHEDADRIAPDRALCSHAKRYGVDISNDRTSHRTTGCTPAFAVCR